jgi:aerobic carbon-monoxide dehydrogenase medium subunit
LKPASFEYHAPETVADAVGLLAEHADEAKPLAGGQSLVPMLALRLTRFAHLVDLNRIPELTGVTRSNGTLTIGAMTRQRAIERDPQVGEAVPLLGLATPHIGHFQIRNRGTVGGSLAHADPASELPAVALTVDAEFELASVRGTRRVGAADFFEGTWTTSAADDELLVATHFPVWEGRVGFAFDEVARRHGDFALTGVAAAVELGGDGKLTRCAIGFLGMGSTPLRARDAEGELLGGAPPAAPAIEELAQLAVRDLEPPDDVHATSRYRTRVGAYLVERTLARALEAAAHG